MTDPHIKPSHFPWPPVIYIAAVAASILLHFMYELPWIGSPLSDILFAAGWLFVLAAVGLTFSALRALRAAKTTASPTQAAQHLVTTGAFGVTRNPFYLGNTLAMIGIGLISGLAWFLPLAMLAAFATQKLAIEPEEAHLDARFGKRYRDYKKRIRRWI